MKTDKDWERWGAIDPYFGVYSREEYRTKKIDHESRKKFFATGEEHIKRIFKDILSDVKNDFSPTSSLDFGCGVGRLLIPLAQRCSQVVGVDISPSMIALAKQNCANANVKNVSYFESDDSLSRISGSFALVHSFIVLQHIPWSRGRTIIRSLSDRVAPGGVLAIQFYSKCTAPKIIRWAVQQRYIYPPLNWLRNLLRCRPIFEPAMQLHVYDLDIIIEDLKQLGFVCKYTDESWGEFRSTFLYALKVS